MTNVIDLKNRKTLKKAKLMYEELLIVRKVLTLTLLALKQYDRYSPAYNLLSPLQSNLDMVQIHLEKIKKIIDSDGSILK